MISFIEVISLNLKLFLFLIYCAIVGFAVTSRINLWQVKKEAQDNIYLQLFFAFNVGLMVCITILFLLGIAGWLNRYAVFTGGIAIMALAVFSLLFSSPLNFAKRINFGWAAFLELMALTILFVILVLKAVKAPGHWDDTMYHLPLVRFYLENHAIVLNEYLRFPLFPQNIDLLIMLGSMMGGDIMAQGIATLPWFIVSVGLIGAGCWLLNSIIPGYLSVLVLLKLGPLKSTMGYAYIDIGLAMFCWGAILALALWLRTGQRSYGWLFIAGMLAGGAAGSKYFGLVMAFLLGLYLLIVRRDWRSSLIYALSATLFGSWWYLRSAVIAGDPFNPVGGKIFGYFLWDAQDLQVQIQEQATHGVNKNLLNIWPALFKAGIYLWVPAFLSFVFFRKEDRSLQFLHIIFLSYFLFWFFATQVSRYLAPIYAVGSLLTIYFLYKAGLGRLIFVLRSRKPLFANSYVPSLLTLIVLFPIFATSWRNANSRIANWEKDLENRAGYTLFQHANKLIADYGSRLIQVGFENGIYFYKGIAIGDVFGLGRYRNMVSCGRSCQLISPLAMTELMNRFDSRMLAVNTKIVAIDVNVYNKFFDIAYQTKDGYLLIKK